MLRVLEILYLFSLANGLLLAALDRMFFGALTPGKGGLDEARTMGIARYGRLDPES